MKKENKTDYVKHFAAASAACVCVQCVWACQDVEYEVWD